MKFEFIDAQKAHFPVDFMCQQLGVSRSGYYAWKERPRNRGKPMLRSIGPFDQGPLTTLPRLAIIR